MQGTRERLVIDGDRVAIVTETVRKEISLEEFVAAVSESGSAISLSFPPNSALVAKKGSRTIYVTAHAPQVRSIRRKASRGNGLINADLAFPWVVFVHIFRTNDAAGDVHEGSYVFFANKFPDSWDALVCPAKINNVHNSGKICLGYGFTMRVEEPAAKKASDVENHFWSATFNHDLSWSMNEVGGSYREWANRTRKDPSFITKADWASRSLREQLSSYDVF